MRANYGQMSQRPCRTAATGWIRSTGAGDGLAVFAWVCVCVCVVGGGGGGVAGRSRVGTGCMSCKSSLQRPQWDPQPAQNRQDRPSSSCRTQQALVRSVTADNAACPGRGHAKSASLHPFPCGTHTRQVRFKARRQGRRGRTSARFVAVVIAPAPLAICRQRAQESRKQQMPSTSGVRLVDFHQSGCQARQAVPRSQCCGPTYLWAWGRGRSGGAGSTSYCCPSRSH